MLKNTDTLNHVRRIMLASENLLKGFSFFFFLHSKVVCVTWELIDLYKLDTVFERSYW